MNMSLLQMSFSGAILIAAVIVVRAVSINKLPKSGRQGSLADMRLQTIRRHQITLS